MPGGAISLVGRRAAAGDLPSHRGLVSARCVNEGPRGYLAIRTNADPGEKRTDRIAGEVVMVGMLLPGWGLHLADMNLAMGKLIA